jgi:hypothetical protein
LASHDLDLHDGWEFAQPDRFARHVSRVARRNPERLNPAGPSSVLPIIAVWTSGITVGWAGTLWPHLPDEFPPSTGMDRDHNGGFLDVIHVSLVALATLGNGEITPQATRIRLVAPPEASIGFSLDADSISYVDGRSSTARESAGCRPWADGDERFTAIARDWTGRRRTILGPLGGYGSIHARRLPHSGNGAVQFPGIMGMRQVPA